MRLHVESSMLKWVEYDHRSNKLTACFRKSSDVYAYFGVANVLFLELVDQANESIGKWMQKNIISHPDRYSYQKLPREAFEEPVSDKVGK